MEQQVIGMLKLNKAVNEMYRKVKDLEQQVQTNLLVEKQDMENVDFKFINVAADSMEFRNNIKLHSEQFKAFEETLKEISAKIDEKDIKNCQEIQQAKDDLRSDFELQSVRMDELQVKADRTFQSLDVFMERCQ